MIFVWTARVRAREFIMTNSAVFQNHHENLPFTSIHPEERHLGFLVLAA
jgi:hypothetical protein